METETKAIAPVDALIAKAVKASDSADAMRFAQAALNAANALTGMKLNGLG